jgi:hypothetical protein
VVQEGAPTTLTDANSHFCESGVLGEGAMTELLAAQQTQCQATCAGAASAPACTDCKAQVDALTTLGAAGLADYVQIVSDLPSPDSSYWTESTTSCNYSTCFDAFGPITAPSLNTTRDLRIVEAYDDHVEVEPRDGADFAQILCCFPTQLSFTVRGGSQWIVVANQTFIHHVIADASSNPPGKCRNACDPVLQRLNGRVIESPRSSLYVPDRAPGALDPSPSFLNPMFRFAILAGQKTCTTSADCDPGNGCADQGVPLAERATCPAGQTCICTNPLGLPELLSVRDDVFRFSTNGSFVPLSIALSANASSLVEPQAITYLAPTFELAITDGSINGVIFVGLQTPGVSRSFF